MYDTLIKRPLTKSRKRWLFFFSAHGWTVGVKHYIAGIADGGVLFTEVIKIRKTIIETSCVPPLYCHGQSLKQVGCFMFVACYDWSAPT